MIATRSRISIVYGNQEPSNGERETGFQSLSIGGRYYRNAFPQLRHEAGFATKEAAEVALDARLIAINKDLEQDAERRQRKANPHTRWMWVFVLAAAFFAYIGWQNMMDLWEKPKAMWTLADDWHTGWPFILILIFGGLATIQHSERKQYRR